jgi:hypothetical protein
MESSIKNADIIIKVTGLVVIWKAKEKVLTKMEYIKGIGNKECIMVKVNFYGMMDFSTLDHGNRV